SIYRIEKIFEGPSIFPSLFHFTVILDNFPYFLQFFQVNSCERIVADTLEHQLRKHMGIIEFATYDGKRHLIL
ncbi:MAG: hypothetical protein QXU18_14245, partial [Thermoplasmatales archaeon]